MHTERLQDKSVKIAKEIHRVLETVGEDRFVELSQQADDIGVEWGHELLVRLGMALFFSDVDRSTVLIAKPIMMFQEPDRMFAFFNDALNKDAGDLPGFLAAFFVLMGLISIVMTLESLGWQIATPYLEENGLLADEPVGV